MSAQTCDDCEALAENVVELERDLTRSRNLVENLQVVIEILEKAIALREADVLDAQRTIARLESEERR